MFHIAQFNHERNRVTTSKECLVLFNHNQVEFLSGFITVNETWIYHTTTQTNQMGFSKRVDADEAQDEFLNQQYHGDTFLGCMRYKPHRLPSKDESAVIPTMCKIAYLRSRNEEI